MRWSLVIAIAACAHPPRAQPGLHDDDDAILAFQRGWATEVRPHISDPWVRLIDNRMEDTTALGRYYVQTLSCRDGIRRIEALEKARDRDTPSLIIYGGADALLGRDRCWSVTFFGGMPQYDAEGWLDDRGRLLIAWRIPRRGTPATW